MHINVTAQMGTCSEFTKKDGSKEEVSIVISPLKIRVNEKEDKAQVVTGCNMYSNCYNKDCFYSKGSK